MVIGIEASIDELGRLTIPSKYRNFYNINPRDRVYVLGTEDGLLISKGNYKIVKVEEQE